MEVISYTGEVEFMRPLVEAWAGEAKLAEFGMKVDIDMFLHTLLEMAQGPQSALMLLSSDQGLLLGFMGCVLFDSPLDGSLSASERYWYITPRHRKGRGFIMLRNKGKEWAKDAGAVRWLMTASKLASDKHDKLCRVLRKKMKHFETTFIEEL